MLEAGAFSAVRRRALTALGAETFAGFAFREAAVLFCLVCLAMQFPAGCVDRDFHPVPTRRLEPGPQARSTASSRTEHSNRRVLKRQAASHSLAYDLMIAGFLQKAIHLFRRDVVFLGKHSNDVAP